MGQEFDAIHRYTDLPALLYLLNHSCITLLNPMKWDDTNDSHFLSVYKRAKELSCLNAACFSKADETYHHWRVFAGGSAGVRVTFLKSLLLHTLEADHRIRQGEVAYKTIQEMRDGPKPRVDDLPFLKRYPYLPEAEYRFIYESKTEAQKPTDVAISLRCIRRVTLSPWMPKPISDSVKSTIRGIPGCHKVVVQRSTLIGNEDWMAYGDQAVTELPRRVKQQISAR